MSAFDDEDLAGEPEFDDACDDAWFVQLANSLIRGLKNQLKNTPGVYFTEDAAEELVTMLFEEVRRNLL